MFLEFLCAVDDYDEIEERLQEDVEVPPLTDEELDEMYQRFLARLRERYPDEGTMAKKSRAVLLEWLEMPK